MNTMMTEEEFLERFNRKDKFTESEIACICGGIVGKTVEFQIVTSESDRFINVWRRIFTIKESHVFGIEWNGGTDDDGCASWYDTEPCYDDSYPYEICKDDWEQFAELFNLRLGQRFTINPNNGNTYILTEDGFMWESSTKWDNNKQRFVKVTNNKLYNVNSDIITNFLSRKIKIVPNKD